MAKKIVIKDEQNPEKNFFTIRQDMIKISKERGIPVTQVIDEFMEDLQNLQNMDYEKKIKEIDIRGNISNKLLNSLKSYLIKSKKTFKEMEKKEKKQEKKKEKSEDIETKWTEIEETINTIIMGDKTKKDAIGELISAIKSGEFEYKFESKEKKIILGRLEKMLEEIRAKEEKQKKAQSAMIIIQEIVDNEYEKGNVKNKASYLYVIRNGITGKEKNINLGINIDKETEKKLLKLIDERIEIEKDELYFEQVRRFTRDFQFLKVYPEIIDASRGIRKIDRFTDSESYDRFCSLRELLQKGADEEAQIDKIIKSGKIDAIDEKILLARKEVIEKEKKRDAEWIK